MKQIVVRFLCALSYLNVALMLVPGIARGQVAAQTAQSQTDLATWNDSRLRIEQIEYRAARWEKDAVEEVEQDTPNRGGLIHVYLSNPTKQSVDLAYYRLNGQDESHWLLGRFLAWHRYFDRRLSPGQTSVLEVNAVSETFAEGKPLSVTIIDRTWKPAARARTMLYTDTARVASIAMVDDLQHLLFHVRYDGQRRVRFKSAEVAGRSSSDVQWFKHERHGPSHAICRLTLDEPFEPSELIVLKVTIEENDKPRTIYAHRRAHLSHFPIGAWSGNTETYAMQRRMHIDTLVKGGRSTDDFFAEHVPRYGFRAMVPNNKGRSVDSMRDLEMRPEVVCWMLADEPDWSTLPSTMLFADDYTKRVNRTVPTMITLCRNVKFFEYASIPDIPCMDHYCVGAPTSSRWPHVYGTRLEETAYYTRDLKEASEPKPVWVWSQGIADWDQRPQRYVPTPSELAAQLMLNISRGAKGILWFNFNQRAAEDYPDAVQAMRRWGRVLRCVRTDLLGADPIRLAVDGPAKLDVATLASADVLFVCLTNLDYSIDDEAYPFRPLREVRVRLEVPRWIEPRDVYAVTPDGLQGLPFEQTGTKMTIACGDIEVCTMLAVVSDPAVRRRHEGQYQQALADEKREF